MNPVGNWISVNQAGGIFRDIASDISINPNGMIYLAGNYSDFVKFGFYALPGHNSNNDIFIATLDNNLNWTGVAQAGGWNTDLVNSISLSKDGSTLITGQFDKTTRFDTLTLKGYGKVHSDIFVARSSSFEPKLINSQKNVPVKTSFYKEFLDPDNDRFWTKTSEKVKYDLDTGKLQIINPDSDFDYHSNEFFNLNPKGYYRIEAKVNHLSGVNNWGFGITWGLKDLGNYNSFEISNNGSYCIYKEKNDTLTKIVNWIESDILNIDKPNILRIEKSRTSISFYINNNYVCNIPILNSMMTFLDKELDLLSKKTRP